MNDRYVAFLLFINLPSSLKEKATPGWCFWTQNLRATVVSQNSAFKKCLNNQNLESKHHASVNKHAFFKNQFSWLSSQLPRWESRDKCLWDTQKHLLRIHLCCYWGESKDAFCEYPAIESDWGSWNLLLTCAKCTSNFNPLVNQGGEMTCSIWIGSWDHLPSSRSMVLIVSWAKHINTT